MKEFLRRKDIEFSLKRYGIDALGAMALGLFSSLIVGLIIREAGAKLGIEILVNIGSKAMGAVGPAIGVAVAYGLKAPPLVLFAAAACGVAGNEAGGPAGAFIAACIGAEFGKAVSKETKVDIIVTPIVTIVTGIAAGLFAGPYIQYVMSALGKFIMVATEMHPIPMGVLISVIVGMVLTLPISSAALCVMLELGGIAAGAACAGCCAQMVGFAVASYKENKMGGLISQGLGTSMLQVPNIVKNPKIWIPPTLASAITGPLATTVFKMENIPSGAGMGTSGLVGQFGALTAMGYTADVFLKIAFIHFILPAVLTIVFSEFMRRKNWIKPGDMRLEN